MTEDREAAQAAIARLYEQGIEIDVLADDAAEPGEGDGISVAEALRLLKTIAGVSEEDIRSQPAITGQWSRWGGNYTLVGDVVRELEPGYYDLTVQDNQIFFVPMPQRTDKILRFPHAQVDVVISEIERFWEREEMFREFRMPYKRGILMYGPPGSGKTSALQLIARDVVRRGGVVIVFDKDIFAGAYRQFRRVQPTTPLVVLMEDLDAILESRSESDVLQLLDGAEAMDRVVFVATTNYPEKLGPRIINRPSRFDKRIRVGHPDVAGRQMYIRALVEDHPNVTIDFDRYVRDTSGMSLAHVKELFTATILIGTPYDEALEHLTTMHLKKPTSDDDDEEFREYATGRGGWL